MAFIQTTVLAKRKYIAWIANTSELLSSPGVEFLDSIELVGKTFFAANPEPIYITNDVAEGDLDFLSSNLFILKGSTIANFDVKASGSYGSYVVFNLSGDPVNIKNGGTTVGTLDTGDKIFVFLDKYVESYILYSVFPFGFSDSDLQYKESKGDDVLLSHGVNVTISKINEMTIPSFEIINEGHFNVIREDDIDHYLTSLSFPGQEIIIAEYPDMGFNDIECSKYNYYRMALDNAITEVVVSANNPNKSTVIIKKEVAPTL